MPSFHLCDFVIESNLDLPQLPAAEERTPDFVFLLFRGEGPGPQSEPESWFHHWELQDGGTWLFLGKRGAEYWLRFPDLADFLISPGGNQIRCYSPFATPPETLCHLLLDQVIPLVLAQKGRLALHASAVEVCGGAVAFLGKTGQGKSTLAAGLCRRGFSLLTDDCFLLQEKDGHWLVVPAYPGLRLWEDSVSALSWEDPAWRPVAHYTEKKRLLLDPTIPFRGNPLPLQKAYQLDSSPPEMQQIRVEALRPAEAFLAMVEHSYLLDITDGDRLREHFQALGRVSDSVPFSRLSFPYDFSLLPAVCDAILRDISPSWMNLPSLPRT